MTRKEALAEAERRWGPRAFVSSMPSLSILCERLIVIDKQVRPKRG